MASSPRWEMSRKAPPCGEPRPALTFLVDGLGHHVSGEQFWRSANRSELPADHFFDPLVGFFNGIGVVAGEHLWHIIEHESTAFAVGQAASFTTDTFGDENAPYGGWPHHAGGVELNELHVAKFRASPESERMSVACVFPRTGTDRPATGDAARGEDHGFGGEGMEFPVDTGVSDATRDTVTFLQKAPDGVFHEDVNAFVNATFLQGANDFEARSVADVGESGEGVTPEIPLVDEVLWRAVKHSTPLFEFTNTSGASLAWYSAMRQFASHLLPSWCRGSAPSNRLEGRRFGALLHNHLRP